MYNSIGNDYIDAEPAEGAMVKKTTTGFFNIQGGCDSDLIVSYSSQGLHGSEHGLNNAYVNVLSIRAIGARYDPDRTGDCTDCTYGNFLDGSPGSVSAVWDAGVGLYGRGRLRLGYYESQLSRSSAGPRRLELETSNTQGLQVVRGSNAVLRQVYSPKGLVDIVSLSTNDCQIRFFGNEAMVSPGIRGAGGLFELLPGAQPLRTHHICNPQPSNTNCILFSQDAGPGQTNVFDFFPGTLGGYTSNRWVLNRGSNLSHRERTYFTNATGGYEIDVVSNVTASTTERAIRRRIDKFSFGDAQTETVEAPGTENLTSSYAYYTSTNDFGYGKLKAVDNADGSWQRMSYDNMGRLSELYGPIGNSSPTTDSNLCRVVQYRYATNLVGGDMGTYSPHRPRQVIEYWFGKEVARTYYQYKSVCLRQVCVSGAGGWR